jgi:predicted transglutaminase-like cysteine proteinase
MTRVLVRIAAVGLAAAAAAQAAAGTVPIGASVSPAYQSYGKSDAILGAPSRLAAVQAQQAGISVAVSRAYQILPAVVRMPRVVATDRPDVFGTVALTVERTPLDRRWRQVGRAPLGPLAAAFAERAGELSPLARIDAVNRFVNARVAFENDIRQFGVADRWMAASETLSRGRGDCEDFAIAKLQMLRRAGFAERDLYLVVLHDSRRRADHAVLVVRVEGRLLVLDNGTDRIVDSDTVTDYRPILTFSGNRAWTHGYRRASPTVTYAAAEFPLDTSNSAATAFVPTPAQGPSNDLASLIGLASAAPMHTLVLGL